MKKFLIAILALAMLCLPLAGFAEAANVQLPYGVTFGMNLEEVSAAVGEGALVEEWYEDDESGKDGSGSVFLYDAPAGIGDLQAGLITFDVTCNNSPKLPRLDSVSMSLVFDGNCITAFRATLAELVAIYGQPDSDPFDEFGRDSYQEFGNLSASWTLPDIRIHLTLNQAYTENGVIDLNYAYRLCYDLSDLDV